MVVQSRLAWIGTDRSVTLILCVFEIVPDASTVPVNVSVTLDAIDDAEVANAITQTATTAASGRHAPFRPPMEPTSENPSGCHRPDGLPLCRL